MTRALSILFACLLLTSCATQKPVTVKPSPKFKAVAAPVLPSANVQALAAALPKNTNAPRTLTLACNPAAGADRRRHGRLSHL